ncbi:hypothetical protein [Xanthomonas euroxanthea]|uniref:hypothetical protein n=1 Tax=Xanthomonas euroxanthea TaxID=2259622 RepID=UPI001620EC30|nr:hypothetical protein [Xanthomonas euroxanthea]MBB5769105.1 SPP1 gp7 family putative phage head morphogenesis protein [Xanthomonas euroxanthea]
MNLNPASWFRDKSPEPTRNQGGGIAASIRDTQNLGVWQASIGGWQPRTVSPWLYEALKEAVPMLDGGLGRMVTLDGVLGVEGDNDTLVAEIEEWMASVPVNDLENGYQAMYASQGEEMFEQGHGIAEFVYSATGRDVVGLRVADSKGTAFVRDTDRMRVFYRNPNACSDHRPDGLGNVEAILQGRVRGTLTAGLLLEVGYVELDPAQLSIAINRPEADNPYGTSMLRAVPFVSQILLQMQNSTRQVWGRFGDPSFHVAFSTKSNKVDSAAAQKRAEAIASSLATALAAKARGNSVDVATGVGMNDEISIDVIGAVNEALQIELPARHMIEQIVASFGIPAWMLGVSWAQAAGIAEPQSELVLQDAKTRFARREASLRKPIEAMLRARGRTWKKGDWKLVQHLPSLTDELKRAQAEFLRAQAVMVLGNTAHGTGQGLDNTLRSVGRQPHKHGPRCTHTKAGGEDAEPWAEPDAALPAIEQRTIASMLSRWERLLADVMKLLGLDTVKAGTAWSFDLSLMTQLVSAGASSIGGMAAELNAGTVDAYDRGVINARADIDFDWSEPGVQQLMAESRTRVTSAMRREGLSRVREGVTREYTSRIVAALTSGQFDGQNPVHVAEALEDMFGAGNSNWERLARSEVADAQVQGKREMYLQAGFQQYDWITAGGCVLCETLAASGPYRLDDAQTPLPMRSSHPNCRCSIRALA